MFSFLETICIQDGKAQHLDATSHGHTVVAVFVNDHQDAQRQRAVAALREERNWLSVVGDFVRLSHRSSGCGV